MKPEELRLLPVSELLNPTRIFEPEDTVSQAIGYMRDTNSNEVFVSEAGGTSVATLRDMLRVQSVKTKVLSLASHVPRLNPRTLVAEAAGVMFEHRVRSLPIYDKGKVEGQITCVSILRKLMDGESKTKVARIMTPKPVCIQSNESASKARSEMMKLKVDQLPILKRDKLVGVINSGSIVFNLIPPPDRAVAGDWRQARFEVPAENYSSVRTVTNDAADSVGDTFQNMERENSSYSIILNMGEVQGIVTHRDFMRFLILPVSQSETPMYIIGLPEEPFEAGATQEKFSQVVKYLARSLPNISEARAVIKTGTNKAPKKRYQVSVFVTTPRRRFSYGAFGYELPDVFDELMEWAKKLAAKRTDERQKHRPTIRRVPGPKEVIA